MNALTTPTKQTSLLMDVDSFAHMQRVAGVLALSALFPEHLRKGTKEQAIANGVLVMNMATRLSEDPLTVAQNIYFVSGKPGWSSSYMIAKANQHGVFKNPISWEVTGSGDTLSVTAFAEMSGTGQPVSATCDMDMAKAEGWTKNTKYKSMPEQMLRYRSATFLIRLYCPEVMVGVPAAIEVELGSADDMRDVTPKRAAKKAEPAPEKVEEKPATVEEAEIVSEENDDDVVEDEKEPEQQTEDSPSEEALAKHNVTISHIESDLSDGAPVDATRQFHAEAIEAMKAEAPELFKKVEQIFAQYEQDQA